MTRMKMKTSLIFFAPLLFAVSLGDKDKDETKPEELFENFEDNIAMESERKYSSVNFADFSNDPEFSKFLSIVGLNAKSSIFGEKMIPSSSVKKDEIKKENEEKPKTTEKDYKMAEKSPDQLLQINPNLLKDLFSSGKEVEDVQQELSSLLFRDSSSIKPQETENGTNPAESRIIKDDSDEYIDYTDDDDYDMYSYEDLAESRSYDEDMPVASKLRQRRPGKRRRPYRGRFGPGVRGKFPGRNPEIYNIPGRIQTVPDRKFSPPPQRLDDSEYSASFNLNPVIERGSDCDFYTDSLCLSVNSYPDQEIISLLGANRRISDDMIADVIEQSADDLIDGVSSNQESTYTISHYYGNRREDSAHNHRDFAEEGGFLCPSEIKYAKPKRGKTAQGDWKDIVNVNDYTQTLRMEKCLQPGGTCSYVSHHYKSQCSQVYNYHRLLSWNKERGLHMDIYKVPTCCSCHIMGYSYVYPPLNNKVQELPKSPAVFRPGSFSSQSRPKPSISRPGPLDNLIPDFNPQQELEQFMQTIGSDIKDFSTFGKTSRPVRNQPNQQFQGRPGIKRPVVGGFTPSLGPDLRPPFRKRISDRRFEDVNKDRRFEDLIQSNRPDMVDSGSQDSPVQSVHRKRRIDKLDRRGDGFSDTGEPSDISDPGHKLESIPLETDTDNTNVVNYGYHPIIDFFNPLHN